MNEKRKSKWYFRLLRWGMIGVAVLITLVAVVVTEENIRGKRAWEKYTREHPVDGTSNIITEIPDEQNFARASLFARYAAGKSGRKGATGEWASARIYTVRNDLTGEGKAPSPGDWSQGRRANLKEWQEHYRTPYAEGAAVEFPVRPTAQTAAADVLVALSKYDSVIEELRKASQRPYSRFAQFEANDPATLGVFLEYVSAFKGACSVIQLRALAELGGNEPGKALEDTKLLLRLNDTLRQEPVLIAHLVSLATMQIACQVVYEGLAQHRWSDSQLMELEQALAGKDFLADYRLAMRGELAFSIVGMENMRLSREYKSMEEANGTNRVITTPLRFVPSAFYYQNELSFTRLHDQYCIPAVDLRNHVVSPATVRRSESEVKEASKHYNPYRILALMTFPAISKSVVKFAAAQSGADLARVGCVLERYRLAHGAYPETLEVLAPELMAKLPHDVVNGKPLKYRREEDGSFVLYSVGWNEKDDNGQAGVTKKGNNDREKGDWVWRYPAK